LNQYFLETRVSRSISKQMVCILNPFPAPTFSSTPSLLSNMLLEQLKIATEEFDEAV
jgi:hypothetical protein